MIDRPGWVNDPNATRIDRGNALERVGDLAHLVEVEGHGEDPRSSRERDPAAARNDRVDGLSCGDVAFRRCDLPGGDVNGPQVGTPIVAPEKVEVWDVPHCAHRRTPTKTVRCLVASRDGADNRLFV